MYVKKLNIKGYKKFSDFTIDFNEHINVLIGENESGKSTILEAIDIVLNQKYFINSTGIFEQFFNLDNINKYRCDPRIENLPKIEIELFLSDSNEMDNAFFNGLHSSDDSELKSGILFSYKFDESYMEVFETMGMHQGDIFIPTDYYIAEWRTFAGHKYINKKLPLKNVLIDNSVRRNNLYDSYTKKVFNSSVDSQDKQTLSHQFKKSLTGFLNSNEQHLNIKEYTLGIDENKTILENILDLKSGGVSIQNKGKGKENLIKTEIALEINSDLILLEEPENHLSYLNTRKMIDGIQQKCDEVQMIITTHDPLIVSRLNLCNTLWINNGKCNSLKNIPDETANFFMKTDNTQLLNYILADKVIIVEGNSEYIMLPQLVKNTLNCVLDEEKIEVLSGGGITYSHYVELTNIINNSLLVVTDNDGDQERVKLIEEKNSKYAHSNKNILIKCSENIEEVTFEVCLYNKNKSKLENISSVKPKTKPEYKGKSYDKNLAYMLKNKTESALRITEEKLYKDKIVLPDYIKEGIEWLIQK
ncbi:ATP-dependent nuclease [Neobacillus jeddahensis]|uniref:ATP-dependent nuclease n=1 Tax=Neobacillus jeddahensis TaxID=1461580 RepID=UPI00058B634B|nr:AAA family ATPase [Neobacillus jeddahensis]